MFCDRLSAWFASDQNREWERDRNLDPSGIVKDVLAGAERILLVPVPLPWSLPHVTSAKAEGGSSNPSRFAALNFVRVAFGHAQRARTGTGSNPSMVRWLSDVMQRHMLKDMLSPCEQLAGGRTIPLEDMRRVPLFEDSFRHVGTRHGRPSMILFKQSLRQMQLHASSPVSAIVVSRNDSAAVCLKLRESSRDIFVVLDFALAPQERDAHAHTHGGNGGSTPPGPALVISTSLEQTAARLSGISPLHNRLLTRDRQFQAQLFSSCTICTFLPVRGGSVPPSLPEANLNAESTAVYESVALLKVIGEIDDRGGSMERERERERDVNRVGNQDQRRSSNLPQGPSQSGPWGRSLFGIGRAATLRRRPASRVVGGPLGEGSSARETELRQEATFLPYEQTKRHCRIFPEDESSPPTSPSTTSGSSISLALSSATSNDEDAYQGAWFECMICFEDIPEAEGIHLLPCSHGFCKNCLEKHVSSKLEERRYPVYCPLCMTEQENANPSAVSEAMVQQLALSEAEYTIWSELAMAHLCVRVHCRKCNRSAFVDKEDYEELNELGCPFLGCEHIWCKKCQQSLADDGRRHSCDGSEELNYLVKQMGWKYCPKCQTPVQKNGGCNHMTCATPGCNTHFCYRCGKQITRASVPFLVRSAVNAHFKQCTL